MLRVCSLGSGSGGNALIVEAGDGGAPLRVLVDNGFNLKQLGVRLARANMALDELSAVFVTHEHSDHVGGVAALARKAGIPIYCTAGTAAAARLADGSWERIESGVRVMLGPLAVDPFSVPHDAAEPVQFVFSDGDRRVGLLTDVGESSALIVAALSRLDALLLECNHDSHLLRTGPYPLFLKARIGGVQGHLSNDQSAGLLGRLDRSRLGWIAAMHLSRSNNTPALAQAALAGVLGCRHAEVAVADQELGLEWRSV